MISIARHLYRNRAFRVIFLALLVLSSAWAQKPGWATQKKKPQGPRATALAVMSPDGKSVLRLLPLCIRIDGQFWDASIYQASPLPMALEPGVVYEVERTGNPVGLFTISQPAQQNGSWLALGSWQPPQAHLARTSPTSDDDRPVLRRSTGAAEGATTSAPQLPEPASVSSDPDRPILKHTQPPAAGAEPPPAPSTPPPTVPSIAKPAPLKAPEVLPAISDAAGPDPTPFVLDSNADQEAHLRKTASDRIEAAVLKQAGLTSAATQVEFKEASVRYFDLDGNNTAELVVTAHVQLSPRKPAQRTRRRAPAVAAQPGISPREFYVTFVGREDLQGEMHAAYTRITDAQDLDLDGRLELIDAADVDGDGRGELIFRRTIGHDVSYIVLKIGLSRTTKLFDSAGQS